MSPFWSEGKPIAVRARDGVPQSFIWHYEDQPILDHSIHWRIHTGWWIGREIWRDYWEITTGDGLLCVMLRDMLSDGDWYMERIYE